jgi:hypothetical protein
MRRYVTRLAGALVTLIALATFVGGASAETITRGQTGADTDCTTGVDFVGIQLSVAGGPSYTVPSGKWTITSWSAQGGNGGEEALVVLRASGTNQYTVVGSTSPRTLANAQNTFKTDIEVEGGDLIAFWVQDGTRCARATGDPGDTVGLAISPNSPPSAGSGITVIEVAQGFRLNISVTLTRKENKGGSGSGSQPAAPVFTPQPARTTICTAKPILRSDGTIGTFNDVLASQYPTSDPASPYYGAVPAKYLQGIGLTCDALPGFTDAGYKVNGEGVRAPAGLEASWPAPYEYYTKAG